MKLTKINYGSAVIFGIMSFFLYLAVGILQWSMRSTLMAQGVSVHALQTFVEAPIIGGVAGYLMILFGIVVYNFIARRYPISWNVKK